MTESATTEPAPAIARAESAVAPGLPIADRLRLRLVPDRLYLWDKYRRALRAGEPEIRLIPFLANPGRVSVDVGAHKGLYSYVMARHSRAVHAFEPNPAIYEVLSARLQGFAGRVTTHDVALSNATGHAELRIPTRGARAEHPRGSIRPFNVPAQFAAVRVRTARLDDLDLGAVGLIKIDVEGHESAVLDGARATLDRDRPNLLIELEEAHTGRPLPDMVAAVCSLGYQCLALVRGVLTPFSAFDVVACHRSPATRREYVNNFVFLPT